MIDLDVRDFLWWERKAKVENTMKKINALSTVRLAMHGDESFERHVRDLVDRIEMLEYREQTDEEIVENWKEKTAALQAAMGAMKGMRRR